MRINQKLFLALSSCLFFLLSHGQAVEPDALTRADAVQKAISQNKMILLIVSDTNNCTGCVTLEFSTLPSTNKPTMRQFLGESFILWACGPEQGCTEFRTYAGSGTLPLPMFFIIDPRNPQNFYQGYGESDPIIFYNWARTGLLKMTKPVIITPQPNDTFTDKNIVVQGRSISTNVTIRGVYYKLNAGAWTYTNASDLINWQIPLDATQVADSNVLQVYALDGSLNKSQTNTVTFFYSQGKTPTTVTLGGLSYIYDGTAKTATAMTVPAGLTVSFSYNGSATAPINAGSYTVIGTINDSTYQGSTTDTLFISKATAAVSLTNLQQPFDNLPKSVSVTTTPPNLSVNVTYSNSTYSASANPPTTSGSYTVIATVTDPNYVGSATGTLLIGNPPPTPVITGLDPNQVTPGGKAFTLTVNGDHFQTNSVIRWNEVDQFTSFEPPNSLITTISKSLIASQTIANITVFNAGFGGQTSAVAQLVVGEPALKPAITNLDPNEVIAGSKAFTLTVNGVNFQTNAVIRWNSIDQLTSYEPPNSLVATISKSLIATAGLARITVFNPDLIGGKESDAQNLSIRSTNVVALPPTMTWQTAVQNLNLGWPTNGFKLQSISDLSGTNWQDVAGSEATNSWSVTVGASNQFYRLKQ